MKAPDLPLLIALAADGKIDRRDWAIIDCLYLRGIGVRETARRLRLSHTSVRWRAAKLAKMAR